MNKKQKRTRNRILLAIALFVVAYVIAELLPLATWFGSQTTALWVEFALFLVPYLIAGYDVLPVSYTHLDVYKRQGRRRAPHNPGSTARCVRYAC